MTRAIGFWGKRGDRINAIRRNVEMLADQVIVVLRHQCAPPPLSPSFDGSVRFALISVNFSTTRYLKLMLLTLMEQDRLDLVTDIVLVDNDNRDQGQDFIRALAKRVSLVHVIENRFFPTHARGMRLGIERIRQSDRRPEQQPNVLLFCDSDVIFRRTDVLTALERCFTDEQAGFVGELRHGIYPIPEAQASFIAVRRDVYDRPDVIPMVHHGAPSYFMQRSLRKAGVKVVDFASNFGGYILHRGRSGVAATRSYRTFDAHATASSYSPHFMGVPEGQQIWSEMEAKYAHLLEVEAEDELLNVLSSKRVLTYD